MEGERKDKEHKTIDKGALISLGTIKIKKNKDVGEVACNRST